MSFGGGSLSMPTIVQRVQLDASKVESGARSVEHKAGGSLKRFFAGAAKGAAILGLALGAGGLVKGIGASVREAADAQVTWTKYTSSLEANGKVTVKQVEQLSQFARAMQLKSQFDADSIRTGIANLAQFKLTGDQLKQITPLVLDYAARTGTDVPSASKKIGLALIGSTKSLRAVGIQYKSTGDRAKDFLYIQELLRQKVGGFAEKEGKTYAGRVAAMHNAVKELRIGIGNLLLPVLTLLAALIVQRVIPPMQRFVDWFGARATPAIQEFALLAYDAIAGVVKQITPFVRTFLEEFDKHRETIIAVAAGLGAFAGALLVIDQAQSGIDAISSIGDGIGAIIAIVSGGAFAIVVASIVAVAAAFVVAYIKIKPFHDFVDRMVVNVRNFGLAVKRWFLDTAVPAIQSFWDSSQPIIAEVVATFLSIVDTVVGLAATVPAALGVVGSAITTVLEPVVQWINDNVIDTFFAIGETFAAAGDRVAETLRFFSPLLIQVGTIARLAFDVLRTAIVVNLDFARGIIKAFIDVVGPAWSVLWVGIKLVVLTAFDVVRVFIESSLGLIRGIFQVFTGLIRGDWSKVWEGLKTIVSSTLGNTIDTVRRVVGRIVDAVKEIPSKLGALAIGMANAGRDLGDAFLKGIKDAISGAAGFAKDLADGIVAFVKEAWNAIAQKINDFVPNSLGWGAFSVDIPDDPIPRFARGAIAMKPMLAVVGDNPVGEAIIPLDRLASIMRERAVPLAATGTDGPAAGNIINYNYNVTGPHIIDEHELMRRQKRDEYLRRLDT